MRHTIFTPTWPDRIWKLDYISTAVDRRFRGLHYFSFPFLLFSFFSFLFFLHSIPFPEFPTYLVPVILDLSVNLQYFLPFPPFPSFNVSRGINQKISGELRTHLNPNAINAHYKHFYNPDLFPIFQSFQVNVALYVAHPPQDYRSHTTALGLLQKLLERWCSST